MGKALYRKYRPKSLAEVVGQTQVTDILANAIKNQKISHAYLFAGPRGTGKTSVARIFAHEINGFKYDLEDNYVDIIEIDGASNRGIENIRELRDKSIIAPTQGQYKIYIIDEVHMLTREAFNALLKTLEEPPVHVVFIMATTDPEKVPVTITSRAQIYTFKLASKEQMLAHLRSIAQQELIDIDDAALEIIALRGGGSFRDSLSLLDQVSSISDGKITREIIEKSFGLPKEEKILGLLNAYEKTDFGKITSILKDLFSSGIKADSIASDIINRILDSPKACLIPLLAKLPDIKAPFAEAKLLLALMPSQTTNVAPTEPTMAKPAKISIAPKPDIPPSQSVATKPVTANQPESKVDTKPKPTATEQPKPTTTPTTTDTFSWESFIAILTDTDGAAAERIAKCRHQLEGNMLHVYPDSKFCESHLKKEPHLTNIHKSLNNTRIKIHNYGESSNIDGPHSKISGIMGEVQEVNNDGGEIPF